MKFSEPQEYILTSTQQIILAMFGVGSGKTHMIGFKSGYFIIKFPIATGFVGANTAKQLDKSTLKRVREEWQNIYGWEKGIDYVEGIIPPKEWNIKTHYNKYTNLIVFRNGAVVMTGSLENAKAIDGVEFDWAFLDETKDTREKDVKETILTRLRGGKLFLDDEGQITTKKTKTSFHPLYITTSPALVPWLNEWFNLDEYQDEVKSLIFSETTYFKKEYNDKCVVIASTYHNKENLPSDYISKVYNNNPKARADALIYASPYIESGAKFYSSFNRYIHVKPLRVVPGVPIHISFDQNRKPYITATIYQIIDTLDKSQIRQIDEFCFAAPKNHSTDLANAIIGRYSNHKCFIYGDRSGNNQNTVTRDTDYSVVFKTLAPMIHNGSDRTNKKNPSILNRKDFINKIFEGKYPFEILIDPKCVKSVLDFSMVTEDENGKKNKKVKNKDGSEKYCHTSDSFDYFITKAFSNWYKRDYK